MTRRRLRTIDISLKANELHRIAIAGEFISFVDTDFDRVSRPRLNFWVDGQKLTMPKGGKVYYPQPFDFFEVECEDDQQVQIVTGFGDFDSSQVAATVTLPDKQQVVQEGSQTGDRWKVELYDDVVVDVEEVPNHSFNMIEGTLDDAGVQDTIILGTRSTVFQNKSQAPFKFQTRGGANQPHMIVAAGGALELPHGFPDRTYAYLRQMEAGQSVDYAVLTINRP